MQKIVQALVIIVVLLGSYFRFSWNVRYIKKTKGEPDESTLGINNEHYKFSIIILLSIIASVLMRILIELKLD